ncbi:MAG: hypothetical protein ABI555_08555 [Chloroflexota bacterium]
MSVTFEAGALRWFKLGEIELIRGLYVAVRDDCWGTIAGSLGGVRLREAPDSFEIRYVSRHRQGQIDFTWQGHIAGDRDGTIRFSMDGMAGSTFQRNRIGICVLHPMDLAGSPMRVVTPEGIVDGVLPEGISPHQPFPDIIELRWPVTDGIAAVTRFEGDVFEMEDQRNWTDASFKTFSTPLRLPYPVTVERNTPIRQSVTFELEWARSFATVGVAVDRAADAATRVHSVDPVEVHVDLIGPMPQIGTSLAPGRERLTQAELDALRTLHPAIVRTVIELDRPGWETALADARQVVRAVDARLEIEAVAGDDGSGLDELVAELALAGSSPENVFVFPTSWYATTDVVATQLRELAKRTGLTLPVGGGSRANFAEFNRADLPIGLLDAVGFPVSPQVHAFDDESVLENIAAQPVAIRTAQALSAGLPMTIGPVTLRPRFNPYGPSRPVYGAANDAERRDSRQVRSFTAAWTIGSLEAIAGTGVAAVLIHEVTGPAGLISTAVASDVAGALSHTEIPVYAAVRDVTSAGATVMHRTTTPSGVAALALGHPGGLRLILANLKDLPRTLDVRLPRMLGQVTVHVAGVQRLADRHPTRLDIAPYGVVRVDAIFR